MAIKDIQRRSAETRRRAGGAPSFLSSTSRQTAEQQVKGSKPEDPWAKDTSHIKTATEAQEALDMTKGQAASLLTKAPEGTLTAYEERQLGQIEEKGFGESFLSGLQGFAEFIDRPRALISLAIQDLRDVDDVMGGGTKTFGVDAYIDTILGKRERLVEKYGADKVGERGDFSTSLLLDDVWESDDDDPMWDKILRAGASFTGDVLLDPTTYVTFGGAAVGTKALKASVDQAFSTAGNLALKRAIAGVGDDVAETALERSMRLDIVKEGDEIFERLVKQRADDAAEVGTDGATMNVLTPDDVLRKQAYEEAAGRRFNLPGDAADMPGVRDVHGGMGVDDIDFHGGVVGRKADDVREAVTRRNFGTLRDKHKDYIDHVFTSRTGQERIGDEIVSLAGPSYRDRLGDAFTTGGMRIGSPFAPRKATRPLRFTQGAFERWQGLKQLHAIPQGRIGKKVAQYTPFIDAEAVGIQVARRLIVDEANPAYGLRSADLSWIERQMLHGGQQVKNDETMMRAYNATVALNRAAKAEGVDPKMLYRELYPSIQRGVVSPTVAAGGYSDELMDAFSKSMKSIHETMADSYGALKRLVPGMGHIENYVPIVFSPEFQRAARTIEQASGAPFSGDDLEGAARSLSRLLPEGEEISVEEMTLFMEAYTSMVATAGGKSAVGTASAVRRRQLGQYLKSIDDTSQSTVLFDVQPRSSRTFVDQADMSASLTKVMRAIGEKKDSPIKWKPDAEAFVTDPVKLLQNYTAEMTAVAQQRVLLNSSIALGAVRRKGQTVDVDHLLFALGDDFFDVNRGVVERAVAGTERKIQEIIQAPVRERTINLGNGSSVTVAAEIADTKVMQELFGKLRRFVRSIDSTAAGYQRRLEASVQANIRKGVPEDQARQIAAANIPELQSLRIDFNQAVEDAYEGLLRDARRVWFETSRDGQSADEAINAARSHVAYLKEKQKAVWADAENQYLRQMDENWDDFPMVQKTAEQTLPFGDVTTYEGVMALVLQPVRDVMDERKAKALKWLEGEIDKLQKVREELREKAASYTKPIDGVADANQEYQVRTLNALRATGDEMAMYHDVYEAMLSARSLDEDVVYAATQAARSRAMHTAAEYVANTWNGIVESGIARRRSMATRQGPTLKTSRRKGKPVGKSEIADRVEKLWKGLDETDEDLMKRKKLVDVPLEEWTNEQLGFYRASKMGRGDLTESGLDSPWFYQVIADGVQDDWDEWAKMVRDPFFADMDIPMDGATILSRSEITNHLDTRIAKLEESIEDLSKVREIHKTNLEQAKRYEGPNRTHAGPPTPPIKIPKELQKVRRLVDLSGEDDNIAFPLLKAYERLDEMKMHRAAFEAGDEEVVRTEIIERMAGRFQGLMADADYMERQATRGMQVGDTLVVTERAFRDVAMAAREPLSPTRLASAVDTVNRQLDNVPGGMKLRVTGDGQIAVIKSFGWERVPHLSLDEVMQGVKNGTVSTEMLESRGIGFVTAITEVEGALELARRTAASMSAPTIATKRKLARSYEAFEDFVNIVDDILQGKATAEKLRRWAYEGSRSGGSVSESKQLANVLAVLPVDRQAQTRRLIGNIMAADPRVAPKAAKLMPEANEAAWNEVLFKPLEATMHAVDQESAKLLQAARAAQVEEAEAFYTLADDFLKKLTFVEEWRRAVSPDGTLTEQYAKKIGPEGERTLREAMGDLHKAQKRLRTDGPFKYDELVDGKITKTGKIKAKDLGATDAEIKRMGKDIKKATKRATVDLTEEGFADPGTYGLGGILDGYLVDPVVGKTYRNLVEGQKYLYTPEGIGDLRRGLRHVLDWWRPAATIANPSFHVRNGISAVANNMLIGVGPGVYPKVIKQYTKFKRAYNALGTEINGKTVDLDFVFNQVDAEFRPMIRAAYEQDILGTGFARGDVAREITTGRPSLKPWDKDSFVLFRAGGKTMEDMEDVVRLAAFYKYFDPNHAAESSRLAREMTMLVHFNYQDLAMMEHKFKRIAPFFIWTRRNVPLQIRALIERPGYAQVMHHFSNAMNDNLGSERYRDNPLPSWFGSMAMPLGFGHREDGEEWVNFVWDPDLPLSNLEDFPLFKRPVDSELPVSTSALSPVEWITWTSQLLGPQFSLPMGLKTKGEEGDYETNAPAGLNEIGLLLENIDFFNLIDAEGSDWRWSGAQSDVFNTAIPFYKNFTGAFENNPGRASRQAMPNDPGVADRIISEILGLGGAGIGLKTQTPSAAGGATFDAQEWIQETRSKSKVRAGDNPLAPGT